MIAENASMPPSRGRKVGEPLRIIVPRLVVTLTMRPHFRSIILGDDGPARAAAARSCGPRRTGATGPAVTSQKRSGCCQFPGRKVAWPMPALLTRMSIAPKWWAAWPDGIPATPTSWLRSASIVSSAAALPCSRALPATDGEAVARAIDRGDPDPGAEQPLYQGPADAARRAGHDCRPLRVAHRHLLPPTSELVGRNSVAYSAEAGSGDARLGGSRCAFSALHGAGPSPGPRRWENGDTAEYGRAHSRAFPWQYRPPITRVR